MVVNSYSAENNASLRRAKRCKKCGLWLLPLAFSNDFSSVTEIQSYCDKCKALWDSDQNGIMRRFFAHLRKNHPECLGPPNGWTAELFIKRWELAGGRCESCGAGLSEWQGSGYRMDRIDSRYSYEPGNCRFSCWPCNKFKSNKGPAIAMQMINALLIQYGNGDREHGWGRIPWSDVLPEIKRFVPPDNSQFIVADPQMLLFPGMDTP